MNLWIVALGTLALAGFALVVALTFRWAWTNRNDPADVALVTRDPQPGRLLPEVEPGRAHVRLVRDSEGGAA